MSQPPTDPLRDALDHIMRVARQGIQPTRRLDWIATRAKYALEGRPWTPGTRDEPRDSVAKMSADNAKLREKVRELPPRSIAERMFDGFGAETELEDRLCALGAQFESVSHDEYDCSLELRGVADDYRLSEDAQRAIIAAGFAKVYVNHKNKWETHYSFKDCPVKGWRVSYPHRRGDEGPIWVEEHIPGWPQEWFSNGKVLIKAAV